MKQAFPSIRVAILGEGLEQSNLKVLPQFLGLTDEIDFFGFQTNTLEWYNRNKLSVITSERKVSIYVNIIYQMRCFGNCIELNAKDIVKDSLKVELYRIIMSMMHIHMQLLNCFQVRI